MTASEHTELLPAVIRDLCGDEVNGGFIRDLCFTVWSKCHNPTHEDGNTDWGNDTLPTVQEGVKRVREKLAALAISASDGAEPVPVAWLDANEIWEFLYGRLKGSVPDDLSDEVLADLASLGSITAARSRCRLIPRTGCPSPPLPRPVMVDLAKLDELAVEAAAKEFLSYKGERPTRVTRRGAELWEDYTPAMRAAIAAYFKALRESSEKGR